MAIAFTNLAANAQASSNSAYGFSMSRAATAKTLLLAAVYCTKSGATASTATLSGGGVTWTKITELHFRNTGGWSSKIAIYRGYGVSPSGSALTATFPASQDAMFAVVDEVSETDQGNSGADAIADSVTAGSLNGTGTSLSVAVGALQRTQNATWAAICHETNEGQTPGSGATELCDTGAGGTRIGSYYEVGGDGTVSASWTTNSFRGACGVEVRSRLAVTGSVTPTGALTTLRTALASLAGSITPTGALTTLRTALASLAGSITPTGALTTMAQRAVSLAGSITPVGGLTARKVRKLLHDSITGIVSLATRAATTLSLTRKDEVSKTLTSKSETSLTLTERDETTDHPVLTELDEENA